MNLFRGSRRSSLDVEAEAETIDSNIFTRGASICKGVFLPRSRTTTSCNLGGATQSSSPVTVGTNNDYYIPNNRRTASLSRNLTRRSRSVTMPDMNGHQQFSTFKKQQPSIIPTNHVEIPNSNTEGCLSALSEAGGSGEATPKARTPDVSQGQRRCQLSSLDSLLDESGSTNNDQDWNNIRTKSNSLPKTAFGSLQLRVAKIKAQLDTYTFMKTPTVPNAGETTMHPNTPSVGYEYSLPPNLTNSVEDSPPSSPNRNSPYTTTTTTSSNNSSIVVPPFLPLTMTTTGSSTTMSSSPSTLSPASSNSLPPISRPQNLKLPQSHSLNTFPASNNKEAEELNRLIFFFDVMSTQEKIAKVPKVFSEARQVTGLINTTLVMIWPLGLFS